MSVDEEDDDSFLDKVLDKQMSKRARGNTITNVHNKPPAKDMSYNPKDMVRGNPIITSEEAEMITEWKELQQRQAEFKKKHNLTGYAMDDLRPEGNKLVVDTDKVDQRRRGVEQNIAKLKEINRLSSQGVKHFVDGKTVVLPKDTSHGN